jgi:type I restriction enzyme, S subunit
LTPADWRSGSLGDLLSLVYRYPTYFGIEYVENGVAEVRGEVIREDGRLVVDRSRYRFVSERTAGKYPNVRLASGDFVMTVRGTIGKVAQVPEWLAGAVITANLIRLSPDQNTCQAAWLRNILLSPAFKRALDLGSSATTIKTIQVPSLVGIPIAVPSLPEQRRIAKILDTIDEVIRKTEQVIAKLQQMKQGLLHDLLTRGIDDNGELRDPVKNPEQFKESELGLIPRGWDICELGCHAKIQHGYAFDGSKFSDLPIGPVLLTPGNFHRDGGLYFTSGNTKHYTGGVPMGYTLKHGDLVTVMTDLSPQTLILGRAAILREGDVLLHNQRIGKVSLDSPQRWHPAYLSAVLNGPVCRRKVIAEATGTTVRHTSPDRILSSRVCVPSLDEQAHIMTVVQNTDTQLQDEMVALQKLRLTKTGMLEDLLTGQVRTVPTGAAA